MIRKFIIALTFALPSLTFAVDMEGYYITAKGGISKSMDTGVMNYTNSGTTAYIEDGDLGTGYSFGLSFGKVVTDNFRLEIEATKRASYEYDSKEMNSTFSYKSHVDTKTLLINGFYDFQPFSMGNTSIKPYLGGGVGISRNDSGNDVEYNNGSPDGFTTKGVTITQFAYKFSAGTLLSLTEKISVDLNYQYVNLGGFKGGTTVLNNGVFANTLEGPLNGGEIKTQELMVGLQYKF